MVRKKDVEHCEGLYRKTDTCVFPYRCECEDCKDLGWSAKPLALEVDKSIMEKILKGLI